MTEAVGSMLDADKNRLMTLVTPLENETLLLNEVTINESISELFEIRAELFSPNDEIDFDKIVGQNVSLKVTGAGAGGRYFNGIVSNFSQGNTLGSMTAYTMEIRPYFWFLSQNQRCRIFPAQDTPSMTIEEILRAVFARWKGLVFDLQFTMDASMKYCVQYLESDFAFCSRIMEETGLGYYFTHEEDAHTLVVFNELSSSVECPSHKEVRYWPSEGGTSDGLDTDLIKSLRVSQSFHPSTFSTSDYNSDDPGSHKDPGGKLISMTTVTNGAGDKEDSQAADEDPFEVFSYPGRFEHQQDGEALTGQLAGIAEQYSREVEVESECTGFTSGHTFTMKSEPGNRFDSKYLITQIEHTISQPIGSGSMDDAVHYSNKAKCMAMPSDQMSFIQKEKTPKPNITGIQVATVVSAGTKGLDLDEKGRVLVNFPWDRDPDTHSCRMRVSQSQAGSGWGGISIPHVGQEVLVAFLGGDPDRPLVVGRVYNEANIPTQNAEDQRNTTMSNHSGVVIEMGGQPVADVE